MDPNSVVGTPNVQAQPVAPVAPVAPVGQPEPNPMVAAMPEKKSSKGGVIAAILFAVLAAGGIGFGVYTMLNSKTQEDALNDQIATLKKQNAELMDQIAEGGGSGSDSDSDSGSGSGTAINAEDYIYIDGFGIKVKKSENWLSMVREYSYYNGYPQAADEVQIRESSNPGDGIAIQSISSCDNRYRYSENPVGECFTVADKDIIVRPLVEELTPNAESPLSEEFLNYFTNPENYSAI